jgi:hypothetical protein
MRHEMQRNSSTPSKGLGSAVHLAIWEPERFQDTVEIWADTKTRGKGFQARAAELPDGHLLITGDEAAKVAPMVASVTNHPKASQLLRVTEQRELTIVFELRGTLAEAGLITKARPDGLAEKVESIIDLKTTQSAAPTDFTWSIKKYGYHHQAAVYRDAARAAGLVVRHHAIIAVENEPPYATAVYRISDTAIETAWLELEPAISTLARCYEDGEWPAYPTHVVEIGLPEENTL